MEQTASNRRSPSIGSFLRKAETFPEIHVMETFDNLDFPVEVENRKLGMDSYPRMYAVFQDSVHSWIEIHAQLAIFHLHRDKGIEVIYAKPRLTLQEAMKDAKKWARRDWLFVCDFLVGRVTSKGLRKLSFACRFPKFLARVKTLQVKQKHRSLAASVGLQQCLPAHCSGSQWCAQIFMKSRLDSPCTVSDTPPVTQLMRKCHLLLLWDIEACAANSGRRDTQRCNLGLQGEKKMLKRQQRWSRDEHR